MVQKVIPIVGGRRVPAPAFDGGALADTRGRSLREIARVQPDYLEWILKQDFPEDARRLVEHALRGE